MSVAERYRTLNSRDLRLELEELYAAYTAVRAAYLGETVG